MKYQKFEDRIEIYDKQNFCPKHILECGQVFCYKKVFDEYVVYPKDKFCKIIESADKYVIETTDVEYFENYFDLKTDYEKIKSELKKHEELAFPLEYGSGIRILKQELLETVVGFIISANNNIGRIKNSLNKIRERFGREVALIDGEKFYAFPTLEDLKTLTEEDFKTFGTGYRAGYLVDTISKLDKFLEDFSMKNSETLGTKILLSELLKLKGVGRKVAECILLFGYGKLDVFPVDTWIKKVYKDIFGEEESSSNSMCDKLILKYGSLSGYAQQYLFYSKRENKN